MRAAIKAIDPRNWSLRFSDIRDLEEVREKGVGWGGAEGLQGMSREREH
jgi:hypothetical protein